ncbi:MAG: hypothetical protein AAGN82_25935 [Myxococcota bacterium]
MEHEVEAERRRRTFDGEVVRPGAPKPALYAPCFTEARFEAMWQHCQRQWRASGRALTVYERSAMPGEVFRIER